MTSAHATRTITARNPDDILAAVPVLIGFNPEDSIVMLTLGAGASFHARVDLPRRKRDWGQVISMLLEPVLAHDVSQVAFVLYAESFDAVRTLAPAMVHRFRENGIDVVDALHADGSRWYPALPGLGEPGVGVPYDATTNPIAVQAVVDGHVTFASRSALAASLHGDPVAVAALDSAVESLLDLTSAQIPAEVAWVRSTVLTAIEGGGRVDGESAARLLSRLTENRVRDAVWSEMTRDNATAHVALWTDLVRRTPTRLLAAPATLLAFAAWLSGHGALAWCALDRCRESEPHYPMAELLAHLLDGAVPPSAW